MTDGQVLRILVIDDDPENGQVLELAQEDWKITTIVSPDPLFEGKIQLDDFDLVVVDLVIHPDEETRLSLLNVTPKVGYGILRWLNVHAPEKPMVVISALLGDYAAEAEFKALFPGVVYYKKPFDMFDPSFRQMIEALAAKGE